jgi:16S rRNA (uracil1498-N3)-methyltransferase
MHVFYAPEISKTNCLPDDESYHAIRVLRLKKDALIYMVDGLGGFYEGTIQSQDPSATIVKIIKEQQNYNARDYRLHILLAPTKNVDRFEFFLEKAVEIGVDEITPLVCEHSERYKLRDDRLERIIISAMKQSYKAFKPRLNPLTSFSSAIESASGINGIAHCESNSKIHINKFLEKVKEIRRDIGLFIGPEGDFSSDEIQAAENKGFIGISLGSSRLRTETAGVVACYAVHYELGLIS